jgi:hypothetical protein
MAEINRDGKTSLGKPKSNFQRFTDKYGTKRSGLNIKSLSPPIAPGIGGVVKRLAHGRSTAVANRKVGMDLNKQVKELSKARKPSPKLEIRDTLAGRISANVARRKAGPASLAERAYNTVQRTIDRVTDFAGLGTGEAARAKAASGLVGAGYIAKNLVERAQNLGSGSDKPRGPTMRGNSLSINRSGKSSLGGGGTNSSGKTSLGGKMGARSSQSGGIKGGGTSSSRSLSGGMRSGPGSTGGSKTGAKGGGTSSSRPGGMRSGPGSTGGSKTGAKGGGTSSSPVGGMRSGPGSTGGSKTGASKSGPLGTSRF